MPRAVIKKCYFIEKSYNFCPRWLAPFHDIQRRRELGTAQGKAPEAEAWLTSGSPLSSALAIWRSLWNRSQSWRSSSVGELSSSEEDVSLSSTFCAAAHKHARTTRVTSKPATHKYARTARVARKLPSEYRHPLHPFAHCHRGGDSPVALPVAWHFSTRQRLMSSRYHTRISLWYRLVLLQTLSASRTERTSCIFHWACRQELVTSGNINSTRHG